LRTGKAYRRNGNAIWPGLFVRESELRHNVIIIRRDRRRAEGLLETSCLGFGFEGLDFVK
jgi:hypothetical protein